MISRSFVYEPPFNNVYNTAEWKHYDSTPTLSNSDAAITTLEKFLRVYSTSLSLPLPTSSGTHIPGDQMMVRSTGGTF